MEETIRIELCGEIGAGKTTLADLLREEGYNVLYDRFSINPFWKNIHDNPESKNLFESEICFALLHYHSTERETNWLVF